MSVTEFNTQPGILARDWFLEKSANVVRFLAPVIEANRARRDLPRDLQEALDFFLSIALSDGLKLLASASGRELTGRELTDCVKLIRDRGEAGFEQVLARVADAGAPPQSPHFELIVGMRALLSDLEAVDLEFIDNWLCNFDWRNPVVQELRDLTCRARAGAISMDHYILSVRLSIDALEIAETTPEAGDAPENLFLCRSE